jgi:uncharacterized protein YndB with AHSA1/START domain
MATASAKATRKSATISDESVRAKTGKTWSQWFAILDEAGCAGMNHKEIVAILDQQHQVDGWWRQMVTVTYEQARGLRDKHQKPDGYSISGSRVINAPIAALFKAWNDTRTRRRWLDAELVIRRSTENKSLRITWADGKTNVTVNLYEKGAAKSQVAVQHEKLASASEAARMKAYWAEALDRLKKILGD